MNAMPIKWLAGAVNVARAVLFDHNAVRRLGFVTCKKASLNVLWRVFSRCPQRGVARDVKWSLALFSAFYADVR